MAKEPVFVPVDLTELQDAGVLMAANERFFWPLGLALTWDHDRETGQASNLHIRQWEWEDGHREGIGLEADDPIGAERRVRFRDWAAARIAQLPLAEQGLARRAALAVDTPQPNEGA